MSENNENPKCPKCGSSMLLTFAEDQYNCVVCKLYFPVVPLEEWQEKLEQRVKEVEKAIGNPKDFTHPNEFTIQEQLDQNYEAYKALEAKLELNKKSIIINEKRQNIINKNLITDNAGLQEVLIKYFKDLLEFQSGEGEYSPWKEKIKLLVEQLAGSEEGTSVPKLGDDILTKQGHKTENNVLSSDPKPQEPLPCSCGGYFVFTKGKKDPKCNMCGCFLDMSKEAEKYLVTISTTKPHEKIEKIAEPSPEPKTTHTQSKKSPYSPAVSGAYSEDFSGETFPKTGIYAKQEMPSEPTVSKELFACCVVCGEYRTAGICTDCNIKQLAVILKEAEDKLVKTVNELIDDHLLFYKFTIEHPSDLKQTMEVVPIHYVDLIKEELEQRLKDKKEGEK